MKIGIIAAINHQGVYAVDRHSRYSPKSNGIPWYIPRDMKHFKQVTTGLGDLSNCVVMGSKTKETIPFLKDRVNIVLTSGNVNKYKDGTLKSDSVSRIIRTMNRIATNIHELWLIGGARVWAEGLPLADQVMLTLVDHELPASVKVYKCEELLPKNLHEAFKVNSTKHLTDELGNKFQIKDFRRRISV